MLWAESCIMLTLGLNWRCCYDRRKHRHTKETIIYITAFRRAIYTAVALRILLLLAGIGYIGRRLSISRLIKLY